MEAQISAEERKRLADQLGLHEQYLYQCLTGRREMSAAEAMRAETATGGALKRQMLCQKTYASIWPELAATPH
jgi:DNA-binding transcriptional regulator YdaS (Cro superfamily)